MHLKRSTHRCLPAIALLWVLMLFLPGCRKEEAAPEAFITLKNNEGFQYRDTTMAVSDVRLFVLITARKGDSYLTKFGNTLFINDKIIGSDTSNLAAEKREGFQAKWYYGALPGTEKGKLVWEFFVVDEKGKKTATQLNIDLK